MKHVTIIGIPKALGSTVSIPLEMLSAANDIARARKEIDRIILIDLVSVADIKIKLSGGLTIECTKLLKQIKQIN